MSSVTIIGAGSMATAVAAIAAGHGTQVQVLARDAQKAAAAAPEGAASGTIGDAVTGDVVVLAVPYPALDGLVETYRDQLAGRVVVDITNPLDFATFDALVVPAGSSAAEQLATSLPDARVLKAFNTNFAATLAAGTVGEVPTTVLVAGDDADAKAMFAAAFGGGPRVVDAGGLRRAHELEAVGFLQLTLAAREAIGWTGGFALV